MSDETQEEGVVVLAETCQVRRAGTSVALLIDVDGEDTATVVPGEPLRVLAILSEPKALARGVWLAGDHAEKEREEGRREVTVADLSERRDADRRRPE